MGRPISLNYQEILDKLTHGMTANEIAKELHISPYSIYKVAKKNDIKAKHCQKKEHPQLKQIIARVLETGNGYQVDREFGLSLGSSKKICRENGVEYPYRVGRQKDDRSLKDKIDGNPEMSVVFELFSSEMDFDSISKKTGISRKKIPKILRRCGINVGIGTNTRRWDVPSSVIELYNSGLGCKEISTKIGIPQQVLRKQLVKWNVPRRVGKAEKSKNPQWKGGRDDTMHKYRRQCYEIAAICLKKPVPDDYIIHHLDENPKNNHPSNLALFPNRVLHSKYHQKALKNQLVAGSKEAIQLALEIGAVLLPEPDFQIEF